MFSVLAESLEEFILAFIAETLFFNFSMLILVST